MLDTDFERAPSLGKCQIKLKTTITFAPAVGRAPLPHYRFEEIAGPPDNIAAQIDAAWPRIRQDWLNDMMALRAECADVPGGLRG